MKRIFSLFFAVSLVPFLGIGTAQAQPTNYLIKGAGPTIYFNGTDGKRHVFTSEAIFKSWYPDFSSVAKVSDQQLAAIPLSSNVTLRPGSKLVKIKTNPRVYAVSRYGTLHWLTTEQVAADLYGADWNKQVVDVPDTYFVDYVIGYQIDTASQYSKDTELALNTPDDNLRSSTFVPPNAPTTTSAVNNQADVAIELSASNAVMNQTVDIEADVTNSVLPIKKVEIYAQSLTQPLKTCVGATNCSFSYFVQTAPLSERFYAVAYDLSDTRFESPKDSRPTLTVAATSDQIRLSTTLQSVTVGSRVSYSSQVTGQSNLTSHKVYALIPGTTTPVLWKDCGSANQCAGSSPFFRTANLYSQFKVNDQTWVSPTVTLTVTGGEAPKPTLTEAGHPAANQVTISVNAPYGETIGETLIKDGTSFDGNTLAMCSQSTCSITLQVNVPGSVTAFTMVGGKYERSNTITVTP